MKHLFVPYEIAIMAKNAGFGEKCLAVYLGNPNDPNYIWKLNIMDNNWHTHTFNKTAIIAPLYQQLADWFREKCGIFVSARESWSFDNTLEFVCTVNGTFVNHVDIEKPINRFDTYYEALNMGLITAFKHKKL